MANVGSPAGDFGGIGIAAHEGDTGDHGAVTREETFQEFIGQRLADIFRQVRAMTARAVTRAVREIEGECYLARNLLKNDIE